MVIEVCDYDPSWPRVFEDRRAEYADALHAAGVQFLSIEHVGSTSVPDLAAKPVIDIDIVVEQAWVPATSAVLERLGFQPRGELGIPQRWAFAAPERLKGTHTYVVVAGSLALRGHLAVRDLLRSDAERRDQYAQVKRQVGAVAADMEAYVAGKNAILQQILAAAGLLDEEIAAIDAFNQLPSGAPASRPTCPS